MSRAEPGDFAYSDARREEQPRLLAWGRSGARAEPGLNAFTIYAALAFGVGAYLLRLLGLFTRFPGTLGDARFNQAVLEHLWEWTKGRVDSVVDTDFFYPYRDMLYFSDNHYGTGAIYVAARALGASREVAFDVWYLVGMAATFAATAYVFRRLGAAALPAIVGAVLFAFSMPMLAQDTHAQLAYRFGVPLAVLTGLQFAARPNLRSASLLAIWVAFQFLCSIYIGVFLVELLGLMGAVALLRPSALPRLPEAAPATVRRGQDVALALIAVIGLALVGWMLARYAAVAHLYAIRREMTQIEQMAPNWTSLLSMAGSPTVGWMTRFWTHTGEYWSWEHQLFPGIGALVLAGAGVWEGWRDAASRRVVLVCLIAIVGLILPAMDFGGVGIYRFLYSLPGLNAIRSMGRVVIVAAFPLAWLGVLGVAALRDAKTQAAALWLVVGLGFALVDMATYRSASVANETSRARIAEMERGLDPAALREKRAVLVRYGKLDNDHENAFDVDLMLAAEEMGVRTFNGFSGSYPPLYRRGRDCREALQYVREAENLPFKRAGADDLSARAQLVPPGPCEAAP